MRINTLSYTNYKGLGTNTIQFSPNLTVLVGKNGSGKTSILKGICTVLSWIIARIRSEKGTGSYIDDLSVTNSFNHAKIEATFDVIGSVVIPNKAKSGIPKLYSIDLNELREYVTTIRQQLEESSYMCSIPVFAFYGVKRAVVDIPLRIRSSEEHMLEAYDGCLNGAADFRNFFMWFRNQEDIENELRVSNLFEDHSLESLKTLDTFRSAMRIFLPEYQDVRIKRRPLRMVLRKGNEELNVAQLSDGEKIYLALIGDLCRKLVLANPSLPDAKNGEGIVMIDEVDLHLHPVWQREIVNRLTEVFPNIQFIVTTHSPQVINHVPTESLRILDGGSALNADYGYGMPTSIVLNDIMGLENDMPNEVSDLIKKTYNAVTEKDRNSFVKYLEKLEERVPNHPELTRLRKVGERAWRID